MTFIGKNRFQQILNIKKLLNRDKNYLIKIISHSTRGAFVARISAILNFRKLHITLFIHQLMNLSDFRQKIKRIFHSLFANEITTSSIQFKFAWEEFVESNIFLKIFYRKKVEFNRMGVYLPRLKNSPKKSSICMFSKNFTFTFYVKNNSLERLSNLY